LDLLKVQELEDYLKNVRGNANTAGGIEFYQPEQEILARYNELQQNVIEIGGELAQLQQKENLTPSEQQRRNQLDKILTEVKQQFNEFSRSPEVRALIEQLSFEAQEQTLSLGSLDRLRDKLGDLNAVLFYPLILEDRLELIITTPNSPPLRRTVEVSREELYRTIVRFRLALQDPTKDAVAPAQKLYQWLFEPLENDLKAANAEVIIYAPDGVLRYIPLVALHDGKQWLAQRFRVNNITAASLEEITTQPQPEPRVLAGAFASESLIRSAKIGQRDVQFAGLPFAGIEVALLQNTLTNTTAYVDEAFNLETMKPKMNGYNVLHFATHAAFVPGDPSESFIVFGEGENPTLRDVENWSLSNVDLVVLSACETGLGGFDNNGEQILGLGYQFQNQGARAVLASLWKVSDGGTQVLMNVFYNALEQGYSKTEALQIAQQSLITKNISTVGSQRSPNGTMVFVSSEIELPANIRNNLDHPYYWASFVLIGNGL
jgi:CHAT domain-containing protein